MNAIPNPFAPTPPPTLPTIPEKGPGGWGNDTASVVDALLEPVFAEYPLVDEQVKDLISRSFEEFMGARKEMRSEKKDQMVIRKLKSRYPEKMASKYANMVQNLTNVQWPRIEMTVKKFMDGNSGKIDMKKLTALLDQMFGNNGPVAPPKPTKPTKPNRVILFSNF